MAVEEAAASNMKLEKLLNKLCEIAINEKLVNFACASTTLYDFNNQTVKKYAAMLFQPSGQHIWRKNTTTYSINVYYIDRLLSDNANDINIFSTAISELKNFVKKARLLDEVVSIEDNIRFQNFIEKEGMSDRCAGVYATIRITVANETECYED